MQMISQLFTQIQKRRALRAPRFNEWVRKLKDEEYRARIDDAFIWKKIGAACFLGGFLLWAAGHILGMDEWTLPMGFVALAHIPVFVLNSWKLRNLREKQYIEFREWVNHYPYDLVNLSGL